MLSALAGLRRAAGAAASWTTANAARLLLVLLIVSVAANVWLWRGWEGAEATIAKMRAAQAEAGKAQAAVNHVPAAKSAAIAEKSDETAQSYYDEGRRAGLAYADAHRVRDLCPFGGPDMPGTDRPAEKHDGAGEPADMVAVTQADFDLLTGNSLRLAKVHQDVEALIAAGVAVPSEPAP